MPNLRGRNSERSAKAESDEEFNFGTAEEAEDGYEGSNQRNVPKSKSTKQGGGKAKKGRKARTWTYSKVVKSIKIEDKLETANSGKRENELEATNSVEQFDSEELNHLKDKRTRGQHGS